MYGGKYAAMGVIGRQNNRESGGTSTRSWCVMIHRLFDGGD